MDGGYRFRPHTAGDLSFIYSSTLRSFQHSSASTLYIPKDIFYKHHGALLTRIIENPETKIGVAHFDDDPDVICGFLIAQSKEPALIHYAYVKKQCRNNGIAKGLLNYLGIDPTKATATHWTYDARDLQFMHRYPGLSYYPYFAA